MKTIKVLLIVFTILIILPVFATQWMQIHEKRYIDLSTVKVDFIKNKKYITVWVKQLNPGDWTPIKDKKVWYLMEQETYNCSDRTVVAKYIVSYGLKEDVLWGHEMYEPPTPIIPQSVGELTLSTLCSMY